MAGRLFDKLEQEAFRAGVQARTKESMKWFQDNISSTKVSRAGLIKDGPTRARQVYGSMYNFQYDPKTKKELPSIEDGVYTKSGEPPNDVFLLIRKM